MTSSDQDLQQTKKRTWLQRGLWVAAALALVLVVCCGLGALAIHNRGNVVNIGNTVHTWRIWGIAAQSLVVALVIVRWNALVHWAHRRDIVKSHELEEAYLLRRRATVFLVAYLVLIPIGPGTLHAILAG